MRSCKEKAQKLVETLLALTPASSEPVRLALESADGKYSGVAERFEEYFETKNQPRVIGLLDMEISGTKISLKYGGVGNKLQELCRAFESKLNDDEFRRDLSIWLGKEVPNPAKKYVRSCLETIKDEERLGLQALKHVGGGTYGTSYSSIRGSLEKEDIHKSEEEIRKALLKISDLGIIETVGEEKVRVPQVYEMHIKELAEDYL